MLKVSKMYKVNCPECQNEFEAKTNKKFCCRECSIKYGRRINKEKKQNEIGIEGVDYLICQYCGQKMKQITSTHLNICNPGKTKSDYKNEFNVKSTFCSSSSKNFGQFMKEEKYRQKYSEMASGDKNRNSKANTTLLQRQQRSPRSIEFYKLKYPNLSSEEQQKMIDDLIQKEELTKLRPTQLEYWLKKGFSEDEAKEKLKERQATNSLQKQIDKHGIIEGTLKFIKRNKEWSEKIELMYKDGKFSKCPNSNSMVANEFFTKLVEQGNFIKSEYHSAINGKEYTRYFKDLQTTFAYDFVHRDSKVIIEFNGDIFHGNPDLYESTDKQPFSKQEFGEIWKKDELKKDAIEKVGYKVIYVWEYDYVKNPQQQIQRCLDFIKENTI
jgi:G:T-mismatch repair DNA endonuclease (very short patch repair protein)